MERLTHILCKIGLHKPSKYQYLIVERWHKFGRKKYRRRYKMCDRCGKVLGLWKEAKL